MERHPTKDARFGGPKVEITCMKVGTEPVKSMAPESTIDPTVTATKERTATASRTAGGS